MRAITALLAFALLQPLVASSAAPARRAAAPVLTIYASAPLQGPSRAEGRAIENGARLALEDAGGHVAGYRVRYRPLDDSLRSTGAADEGKAAHNARAAVKDRSAVGYIGEYNSGISKVSIPILNRYGVAQVSPSNTYVGLTTHAPGATPGEPVKYYPTGRRTYARVVPNDAVQARAIAAAARDAGCKAIELWSTRTSYSRGMATMTAAAAKGFGMSVARRRAIDPRRPNYRRLARRIRAECFVFTGEIELNGVQAVRDAAGAPSVRSLFAGDAMCLNDTAASRRGGLPRAVARRFHCTISLLAPGAYPPDAARVFSEYAKRLGKRGARNPNLLYGYESMALLLDSVGRAAAAGPVTRRAVVRALFRTRDRASVLGTYSIDSHGDTTLTDFGLYKISSGRLAFDRVVSGAP